MRIQWADKSERNAVRRCVDGKAGGAAVSLGALAATVPELDAVSLPFLFEGYAQADRAWAAARPQLAELLAGHGFILGVRAEGGFRHWASRSSFVATPAAFAGRVMRPQPTPVGRSIYAALGATLEPPPSSNAEGSRGFVDPAIDGYDDTLLGARLAGWSDAVSHVTLSSHSYDAAAVVWCKAWLETLPEAQRVALMTLLTKKDPQIEELEREAIALVRVFNDELMPARYQRAKKRMRALSDDERAALTTALGGVEAAFEGQASEAGRKLLATLKSHR